MLPAVTEPEVTHARKAWRRGEVIVLVILILAAGLVRFVNLGSPDDIMFDETYYAKDACWYVQASKMVCDVDNEQTLVHPPLGKWLLAIGIRIFGYDAFGWRFAAALGGTVTVGLLFLLARRLFRHAAAAALAAGLLAFDFLHFVQSRIAMLDIFVPLFGVAAVLFALWDHDAAPEDRPRRPLSRGWLAASGAAAGAAVASKWGGVFYLILVVVLTIAWGLGRRRRDDRPRPVLRTLREEAPALLLWLFVLPLLLYVGTYAARLDGAVAAAPWSEGSFWRAVWDQQFSMWEFHTQVLDESVHPYQSPAWSWLLLKRPVSYFFETTSSGQYMEVMAIGSPLVWWTSILALLYCAYRWVRDRSVASAAGIATAGFFFTYAPWVLAPSGREAVFLFYLLPSVPFMCLAIAAVADRILGYTEGKIAVGSFAAAALIFFGFFYPVLAKVPIPKEQWDQRIRFRACDEKTEEGGPPKGWCWI